MEQTITEELGNEGRSAGAERRTAKKLPTARQARRSLGTSIKAGGAFVSRRYNLKKPKRGNSAGESGAEIKTTRGTRCGAVVNTNKIMRLMIFRRVRGNERNWRAVGRPHHASVGIWQSYEP